MTIRAVWEDGEPVGTALRCPHCDQAMIHIARHNGSEWLDLRGAALTQITEE